MAPLVQVRVKLVLVGVQKKPLLAPGGAVYVS